MAQQRVIEESALDNFLILLLKEPLDHALLPNTLRLLMNTRTYLEFPGPDGDLASFWENLKKALGPPNERPLISEESNDTDSDLQALLDSIVVTDNEL